MTTFVRFFQLFLLYIAMLRESYFAQVYLKTMRKLPKNKKN